LFVNAILVDGPNRRNVSADQLIELQFRVQSASTDEPRLADRRVADHHTFDQLLMRMHGLWLQIHARSCCETNVRRLNLKTAQQEAEGQIVRIEMFTRTSRKKEKKEFESETSA
jgi:hypothetical protein